MLEASGLLENSAAGGVDAGTIITAAVAAAVNLTNEEVGGGRGRSIQAVPDGFGKEGRVRDDEGDRNFGGNRWPRDETLALLKIRSDMDSTFRDSTLKAPLWDEVSRKLAELGYHRHAKKCKEKFENIYKYHKRTKECRSGRLNSKNYRFFEQLELLDNHSSLPSPSQTKIQPSMAPEPTMAMTKTLTIPCSIIPNSSSEFAISTSTSATSSSEKESEGNGEKKKRKTGDYFEKLVKEVLEKQENLQNKFIEALEKCEKDRIEREEAWKIQEFARLKREKEILAQERAMAAAKDAAMIAFLQKISQQSNPVQIPENPIPITIQTPNPIPSEKVMIDKQENNGTAAENSSPASSSRWPKAEVEALISIRANLDLQSYQETGPKGPMWEEISSSMKKLGYNRNAKRCKEKWENINKYFKRVKESNKKRPEDSKTCPYFQMLESLYEIRKSKKVDNNPDGSSGCNLNPEDILMQMMGQTQKLRPAESLMEDGHQSENVQNEEDDGGFDDDDEEEEDDNGDNYKIVANNASSVTNME